MLEFFTSERIFFGFFFAGWDFEKKNFGGGGRRERRKKIFFGKIAHVFGDTPPVKKGGGSIFEGIFRF
jgi:hypothetical protein